MALIRCSLTSRKLFSFSLIALLLFSTSAFACSCRDKIVEEVAYSKDIILTKLRVNSPSISERVHSYFEKPSYSKSYGITVLEDYKGKFTASHITASTVDGETDCSRRVSYGEILYMIAHKNSEGISSNKVSVCNTTSEKFAESVKKEHANPSDAFKAIDTSDWMKLNKTATQSLFADTKNVTKDEYGSYIWVLLNDSSAKYKSQKTQLQISCTEKMYIEKKELMFSELNANGDVRFAKIYERKWLPLTELYLKLFKYTCSSN
jgi:hypothetical protein